MKMTVGCVSTMDLRKANRYRLSASALFFWVPPDGQPQTGRGLTRDINTSGVFIWADAPPEVGARIQLNILLPKLEDAGPGMRLYGEGVVLRVEPRSCKGAGFTECGFAASAQFYPEPGDVVLSQFKCSGRVV